LPAQRIEDGRLTDAARSFDRNDCPAMSEQSLVDHGAQPRQIYFTAIKAIAYPKMSGDGCALEVERPNGAGPVELSQTFGQIVLQINGAGIARVGIFLKQAHDNPPDHLRQFGARFTRVGHWSGDVGIGELGKIAARKRRMPDAHLKEGRAEAVKIGS